VDDAVRSVRATLADQYDGEEPFDFYEELNAEWRAGTPPVVREPSEGDKQESEAPAEATFLLSTLARTRNVILYGPPGTGKTYVARKAAEALIRSQAESEPSESARIMEAIEGLRFYEVVVLSM
jgi:Cdc6-like AAA superfamily ATPase